MRVFDVASRHLLPEDNFGEGGFMLLAHLFETSFLFSRSSDCCSLRRYVLSIFARDIQQQNAEWGQNKNRYTRIFSRSELALGLPGNSSVVSSLRDEFSLDNQEEGIFDAIEKQYLKSFIFAIYLVGPLLRMS